MPALNTIPLETSLPGHTRRRTWAHPELTSHTLLVLTFDRLYLTALTGVPRPEVVAAIQDGADLDTLLDPLTTVVDLNAIRRLHLDLLTNSLFIEYANSGSGASGLKLTFATPEAADACFTRLWRRLGEGFRLTPYKQEPWQLARGPLALLTAILLMTALIALGLSVIEDLATAHPTDGAAGSGSGMGWLHWKFACGLGGVAAAISQVWLYRRLTTPPTSLELLRT